MKELDHLVPLLAKKKQLDDDIAAVIRAGDPNVRFSTKKFVPDLGEFYFLKLATVFQDLKQSVKSNADFDFLAILDDATRMLFGIDVNQARIEVKTRYAQIGNNHIKGLKPTKFDLLAFVALADDYTCRHIGIIRSSDIVIDRQERIRCSDYYRKGLVRWKTSHWTEL